MVKINKDDNGFEGEVTNIQNNNDDVVIEITVQKQIVTAYDEYASKKLEWRKRTLFLESEECKNAKEEDNKLIRKISLGKIKVSYLD